MMISSGDELRGAVERAYPPGPKRGGRRPGESRTRAAVLAAAQRQFSALGYDRTTMRSVAAEAGVDQKLVAYFFGSKHALFVAATTLPFNPAAAMAGVLAGDPASTGERLARLVVSLLEDADAGGRLIGLVRASASDPEAARMVRDLLGREIWGPAAAMITADDAKLAINFVALELLGLVMARYVVRVQPLASLAPEAVVASLGPTLQRHLTGGLRAVVKAPRVGGGTAGGHDDAEHRRPQPGFSGL